MHRVGSWVKCLLKKEHKQVDMYFWRTVDYKFDFCHMCLFAIRKENGTLVSTFGSQNENAWRNHLTKYKPESDSL